MLDGSGESSSCGNKKEAHRRDDDDDDDEKEEILVLQNQKGGVVPFQDRKPTFEPHGRNKKQKLETHQDGQRVRYFHDDDQRSLETLVREEKLGRGSNDLDAINRMAGRVSGRMCCFDHLLYPGECSVFWLVSVEWLRILQVFF